MLLQIKQLLSEKVRLGILKVRVLSASSHAANIAVVC